MRQLPEPAGRRPADGRPRPSGRGRRELLAVALGIVAQRTSPRMVLEIARTVCAVDQRDAGHAVAGARELPRGRRCCSTPAAGPAEVDSTPIAEPSALRKPRAGSGMPGSRCRVGYDQPPSAAWSPRADAGVRRQRGEAGAGLVAVRGPRSPAAVPSVSMPVGPPRTGPTGSPSTRPLASHLHQGQVVCRRRCSGRSHWRRASRSTTVGQGPRTHLGALTDQAAALVEGHLRAEQGATASGSRRCRWRSRCRRSARVPDVHGAAASVWTKFAVHCALGVHHRAGEGGSSRCGQRPRRCSGDGAAVDSAAAGRGAEHRGRGQGVFGRRFASGRGPSRSGAPGSPGPRALTQGTTRDHGPEGLRG